MTTEIVKFTTEQEWLAERMKDITSTEVSALPGIDVNPYQSPWELFQRKKSGTYAAYEVNERMKWGTRLQDAIAFGASESLNLVHARLTDYIRIKEDRVGSSFDYKVRENNGEGPEGLMEVKNVDGLQYVRNWKEDDGLIEAPPHIELQVQHQLLVSGMPYAFLVALVGGNTLKITRREFDGNVGRIILKKVAEFWAMVRDDHPPPPDFSRDAKLIASLYNRSNPGEVIDLSGSTKADELVFYFASTQESVALMQREIDKYKAQLLELIGTAEKAVGSKWAISAKEVMPTPGKEVTQDMVGTFINQRKGFRRFAINLKKEDK
jgi:predicted phage-related endonuclease